MVAQRLITEWHDAADGARTARIAADAARKAAPGSKVSLHAHADEPRRALVWIEADAATEPALQAALRDADGLPERFSMALMREVGTPPEVPAPWLYIVHVDIPDHVADEYNRWYDAEHLPRLVAVPGVVRARRYAAEAGSPRFLTAYELTDRDAFESPAGLVARKTPWTERMRSLFENPRRSMWRHPDAQD